ncbi:INSulin related [Caenorhabditis elegans]|uniref:INSulin related n=1 Tax=Caenorhabditis elegans TaxID=6239 RepID=Q21211_CAEEL|nr:INSulin related [Caenorhabditis elegans]CCD72618.1 INSulin related [Caenorhabditis elegans]|eukprot:NP_498500.1 Uncharacterized protein CELE_K04C2.5 [Caenorhabditis elegans]
MTKCSIIIGIFLIAAINGQASKRRIQYESVSQFLFHNSKLCGDPFSDAVWLPVLDLCSIECEITSEYCVENEELTQQCKKLPEDCQALLRKAIKQIQRHIRSQKPVYL